MRDVMHAFKFRNVWFLGDMLVDMAYERGFRPPQADLIVPVPLSSRRLVERGYNQSQRIARRLASLTGIPMDDGVVEKHHEGARQSELPLDERFRNVRGCYRMTRKLGVEKLLLVDDIMTSTATARELSSLLVGKGGATDVSVFVLCRTPD